VIWLRSGRTRLPRRGRHDKQNGHTGRINTRFACCANRRGVSETERGVSGNSLYFLGNSLYCYGEEHTVDHGDVIQWFLAPDQRGQPVRVHGFPLVSTNHVSRPRPSTHSYSSSQESQPSHSRISSTASFASGGSSFASGSASVANRGPAPMRSGSSQAFGTPRRVRFVSTHDLI
jgi:hypothetical protein